MLRKLTQLTFFLLICSSAVFGEESTLRPTRIIILTEPSDIGTVIKNSTILEAQLRGFSLINEETPLDPDFIITWQYEIDGDSITAGVVAAEAKSNEVTASAEWTGQLSLKLDEEIQDVVGKEIFPVLPVSMPVSRREMEKAAEAGEDWAVKAIEIESSNEELKAQALLNAAQKNHWRAGLSGGVYLPLSDTAVYANTGFGGMLDISYAFRTGLLILSPGLAAGVMYFSAEAKNTATALFTPLGAELRIGTAIQGSFQPWIFLAGGGALFILTTEGDKPQSKFVGYAEAGLVTDIFFGSAIGISAQASFRTVFEGSVTIIHVVPEIGMAYRF